MTFSEDRPVHKLHDALAIFLFQNFGSGNVGGHQVRRKLNATKIKMEDLRDASHQQCFGKSWCPRDQTMCAREQANEQLLDHFLLANNGLRELFRNAISPCRI